jgi:hypothetical protein
MLSVFLCIVPFFVQFHFGFAEDTAVPTFIPTESPTIQPTTPTVVPTPGPSFQPTSPSRWYQTSSPEGFYASLAASQTGQYMAAPSYWVYNMIIVTQNFGNSWSTANLTKVCEAADYCMAGQCVAVSPSGQYMYACVYDDGLHQDHVLYSSDYGNSWLKSYNFYTKNPNTVWISIDTSSSGESAVALSRDDGYVAVTSNAGMNWTTIRNLTEYKGAHGFHSISCDGSCQTFLIAADNLLIGFSLSDPNTITEYYAITAQPQNYFFAATCSEDFQTLAGAPFNNYPTGDYLVLSQDGGKTWIEVISAPISDWWAITMNQAGNILGAIDVSSNVYLSWDNATTWTLLSSPQGSMRGLIVSNDGNFVAASGDYIYTQTFAPTFMPTSRPTISFSPTTVPTVAPSPGSDGNKDSGFSDGVMAGVVVGSFVGGAVLLVAGFFLYTTFFAGGKAFALTKPLLEVKNVV